MKTGVIDVGGGLRGAYGAGVFDFCMDLGIRFDYCIGVSAGSANIISFLAGQKGRNHTFYTEFSFRKEYMSLHNYLKDHNYVDLEYIFGELSNSDGEFPLDYQAAAAADIPFRIVATDAMSGKAHYFDMSDMDQDDYDAIKASSCVPAVNRPFFVNGIPYYDGGISDPIPVLKCFEEGCDRIVLVLTRPKDYQRTPQKDEFIARLIEDEYPAAAAALKNRAEMYNTELALAREYEKTGKVLIVAPDDIGGMRTLTKDKSAIEELYLKGFHDGEKVMDFMRQ
ncbi:MAG: patatin family protein [Erysipelotrichaceae bacterium]|nr:patatin family protein [Erysipelotrichaceae bacterium]